MKYALIAPLALGLAACSPAAEEKAEQPKVGEVSEIAPDANMTGDDIIVPDESVPQDEVEQVPEEGAATDQSTPPPPTEAK